MVKNLQSRNIAYKYKFKYIYSIEIMVPIHAELYVLLLPVVFTRSAKLHLQLA